MELMKPFKTIVDMSTGKLEPAGRVIRRYLSEMQQVFADSEAVRQILRTETDRLIYEVYGVHLPEDEGLVLYSTTIIHPGQVGAEFHMTKGHFHERRDRAEVYLGLAGEGYLVLQTEVGLVHSLQMHPGTVAYVPPNWAHRTVNVGDDPFSFIAFWPGDAGHDYGTIEQTRFAKLILEQNGAVTWIDNPRYPTEA